MIEMFGLLAAILIIVWLGRGQIGRAVTEKRAAGWLWLAAIGLIALGAAVTNTATADSFELPSGWVLLLDASESIPSAGWGEMMEYAEAWRESHPNGLILVFGNDLVSHDAYLREAGWQKMTESDLAGALMELEMLLGSRVADITIFSDWQVDKTAAVAGGLQQLTYSGNRVWAVELDIGSNTERLVLQDLQVPEYVWEGDGFSGLLTVWSATQETVRLEIRVNGQTLYDDDVALEAGYQTLNLPVRAGLEGYLGLEARVTARGQETETRFSSLLVRPALRLLVVSESNAGVARVVALMREAGVEPTFVLPGQIPTSVEELGRFDAILLNNLPASQVEGRNFDSLRWFVETRGGGLLVVGGNQSFTLGGYEDSSIAGLLPVSMDTPLRGERPPLTLVLVIDRSGSMAGAENAPILLAQEAALRVVEELSDGDLFGLVSYADDVRWDVAVGRVGDGDFGRNTADAIALLQAGGGTYMLAALEEAVLQAGTLGTPNATHIILLSDGISSDGEYDDFIRIANDAQDLGISISAIALGDLSDIQSLAGIAVAGDGRYYYVEDPFDLPDVVVAETRAARSENVQTGQTNLLGGLTLNPMLVEFSAGELPAISSYLALTMRDGSGAQVFLESGDFGDPLLSGWQVGSGRVIVWASDLGGTWSAAWQNWAGAGQFWSRVAKYSASGTRADGLFLELQTEGDNASIAVEFDGLGVDPPLALPRASIVMQDGSVDTRDVRPLGPTGFAIDLTGLAPGNYSLGLETDGIEVLTMVSINRERDLPAMISTTPGAFVQALAAQGFVTQVGAVESLNLNDETIQMTEQEPTSPLVYLWIAGGGLVFWVFSLAADFARPIRKGKAS